MSAVFSKNPQQLAELAEQLLAKTREQGVDHAQLSLSQSQGLSLHMRQGRVVARTRETHNGLSLTVFKDGKRGSVNSTDLNPQTQDELVKAACMIARHTGEDAAAGPASAEQLCTTPRDLDLFHPWDIDEPQAIDLALRMEQGLVDAGPEVQSDGAWVNSNQSYFLLATSEGFNHGTAQTSHSLSALALARNATHSELDFWAESTRNKDQLSPPETIGKMAGMGALAYLDRSNLASRRCAVLFDPRSASSFLGHLVQAISGHALYMNASFLRDQLGRRILSPHLTLHENPFIAGAASSIAFDGDGIEPTQRDLITEGVLQGYLLSLYGARRLGLQPTGNGFGPGNLRLRSTLTGANDHLPAMLNTLGSGLLVTSLVGNGVSLISGDYSRGARGFWVENGQIQHAVTGIAIASNLKQMLNGIVAVGSDELIQGAFCTGSILVADMQISGH